MGADAQPLKAAFGNNGSGGGFPVQGPSVRATTASRGGGGEGWVGASPLSSCSYLFRRRRAEMSVLLTVCKVPGIAVLSFVWGDAPQSRQREPGSPGEAVSQQNPFVLTATTEKEVVLCKMHLPQCQRREKNVFCNCTDGTEEHDR